MEQIALRETPFHRGRCTNEEIHRELPGHLASNLERQIDLIPGRHDDQEVNVAVGMRSAVGVRAEQDDLVWLEVLGDLACETSDDAHGNIRPTIPAGRTAVGTGSATVGRSPGLGFHALIVANSIICRGFKDSATGRSQPGLIGRLF